MQCIYRCQFDDTCNCVTYIIIDIFVPPHARAGGEQYCKRIDGREAFDAIGQSSVDLGDCSQLGFDVSITRCLTTPRSSIDENFIINDAYGRIVIVHQVTTFEIAQPHAYLCALACATSGSEGIAIAVLSHQ